ncbi:MAG: hypothetical protein CMC15_13470 [Flavobacteriaceae bacterium]|nr:hypothetical protein [Flavobacteriaceae bacterium]|tara:strand:- start:338 stop:556 length:219 start_codon:yes stop_codon:yes gene_type:complete
MTTQKIRIEFHQRSNRFNRNGDAGSLLMGDDFIGEFIFLATDMVYGCLDDESVCGFYDDIDSMLNAFATETI